jgi:endonuclease YncB( thermonuclease family)
LIKRLFEITLALAATFAFSSGHLMAGTCRVITVHTGDLVELACSGQKSTVRLAGIDAPEMSAVKDRPGQPFCERARLQLAEMVLDRVVSIKTYGADSRGRALAELFVGGVNVNLEMVTAGLAEVFRGNLPETLDLAPYRVEQQKARRSLLGIWVLRDQYFSPRDWREIYGGPPDSP